MHQKRVISTAKPLSSCVTTLPYIFRDMCSDEDVPEDKGKGYIHHLRPFKHQYSKLTLTCYDHLLTSKNDKYMAVNLYI